MQNYDMNLATAKEVQSFTLLITGEAGAADRLWDNFFFSYKMLKSNVPWITAPVVGNMSKQAAWKAVSRSSLEKTLYYCKYIFLFQQNLVFSNNPFPLAKVRICTNKWVIC